MARAHHVLNVDAGVPYARVLEPSAYKIVASEMRQGDLIELRWEPNLAQWALLLVVGLRPDGVAVREILYRQFDDVAPAASIEELAGFHAEQTAINSWQIVREQDGHKLPETYPTQAAARSAIMQLAPKWAGRGWARNT